MRKGVGYCHSMLSPSFVRDTCGHAKALRAARLLVLDAHAVLHILEPMDGPEKKAIQKFKRSIERFEKADQ
jgi:hypothetical protein